MNRLNPSTNTPWPLRAIICAFATAAMFLALSSPFDTASADTNEATVNGPVVDTQGALTIGNIHKCAVKADGSAWCWGSQWYGELGSGAPGQLLQPGQVVGLSSGVKSISAGIHSTCAVTTGGALKCWGTGQKIGDGSTSGSNYSPVDVPSLASGVRSVSVGHAITCVVVDPGGVKCWGSGHSDVGSGVVAGGTVSTPTDVSGLTSGVATVSVGGGNPGSFACALTTTGGVKCWGRIFKVGGTVTETVPVDMPGLSSGVKAIAVGEQTLCVVTTSGGAKCVGDNGDAQFGNGTQTSSDTPVDVTGLTSGVVSVSVGRDHACALTNYGAVKCWGYAYYGRIGDGMVGDNDNYRLTPSQVTGMGSNAVAMTTGLDSTCAITNQNAMYCWGSSITGDGTSDDRAEPVLVYTFGSGVGPTAPVLTTTTVAAPTTTIAAPTTTTPGGGSSGGSSPVPLASGKLPSLDPGAATSTVDGVDVDLTPTRQGSKIRLSSGSFSLSVSASKNGANAPVSAEAALQVPTGATLTVNGTGFKAETRVQVWIVDGKKLLKRTVSTSSGTVNISSVLPASLGSGTYTLQIVGTDENGSVRAVSLGIEISVGERSTLPETGADRSAQAMLGLSVAVLGLLMVVARRRVSVR